MIYRHPDHDAAVSVTKRAGVIQLDLLAKGRSQKRAGGKVVGYATRNPDRRQLVDHLFDVLARRRSCLVVGGQGGKGGGELVPLQGWLEDDAVREAARKTYSAAGNYRWRLFVRPGNVSVERFTAELGLVPDEHHRAVTTEWPQELS